VFTVLDVEIGEVDDVSRIILTRETWMGGPPSEASLYKLANMFSMFMT
jgi:hypothetical protein